MKKITVNEVEKVYLSSAEAQKYLGMSADFMKDLRATAELGFYKLRGAIFYKKADIDRLMERNKVVPQR